MLRTAAWALRQRRYRALAVLMFAVAVFCVAAGTWQISRYTQKVHDNNRLRANAHAAAAPLTPALLPLVGTAPAPSAEAIRYRTVTATGSYLPGRTEYLRNQSIGGTDGFYVITPLRTGDGALLVARGFVAATADGRPPTTVPAPPTGTVRIIGRLQTADTAADDAAALPNAMIDSVNAAGQASRLHVPVYDGYLTLGADQPGGSGLQAVPPPDLSNPAGGAAEWQHLAYVVQWYVFALLALAAPFAMGVHEVREARKQFLGTDGITELGALDDDLPALPGGSAAGGAVALRESGELAQYGAITAAQWQRAAKLADRYGRSLGPEQPLTTVTGTAAPRRRSRPAVIGLDYRPVSSANAPARSEDSYHGSYNDYLWQLALADGNIPDISLPEQDRGPDRAELPPPRVVDVPPAPDDDR